MNVRTKVFCEEQHYPLEIELDEDDLKSWHWVLYQKDGQNGVEEVVPVSVISIVLPPHEPHPNGFVDEEEDVYVKLGRVATLKELRGKGLSRWLIESAFEWMEEHKGEMIESGEQEESTRRLMRDWNGAVLTHAQIQVVRVYEKLGFITDPKLGRWNEGDVEHLGLWKRLNVRKRG